MPFNERNDLSKCITLGEYLRILTMLLLTMLFVIWNMYLASSNSLQKATRVESTRLVLILITENEKIWQSGVLIVG